MSVLNWNDVIRVSGNISIHLVSFYAQTEHVLDGKEWVGEMVDVFAENLTNSDGSLITLSSKNSKIKKVQFRCVISNAICQRRVHGAYGSYIEKAKSLKRNAMMIKSISWNFANLGTYSWVMVPTIHCYMITSCYFIEKKEESVRIFCKIFNDV